MYSHKNNTVKISHSESWEFSSYPPVKFVVFLKSRVYYSRVHILFLYVCKQIFRRSKVRISQKVKVAIMRNLRDTIFYMRTDVLQDWSVIKRPTEGSTRTTSGQTSTTSGKTSTTSTTSGRASAMSDQTSFASITSHKTGSAIINTLN